MASSLEDAIVTRALITGDLSHHPGAYSRQPDRGARVRRARSAAARVGKEQACNVRLAWGHRQCHDRLLRPNKLYILLGLQLSKTPAHCHPLSDAKLKL